MSYVIGIDGGGTKTCCMLADEQGKILAETLTGCTNHQLCGAKQAAERLETAVETLLEQAGVRPEEIAFLCIGLSGADSQQDILLIEQNLTGICARTPHRIVNDLLVAFACGTDQETGAVSICGTGHNTAVLGPQGLLSGINALRYPLGNFGGGRMLTDCALHAAFRCWEGTGRRTGLADRLPALCGLRDMDAVRQAVYESGYTAQYGWPVPRLVDELALEGDEVSQTLLCDFGRTQGEMLSGLLRRARLTENAIPVVLSGSIYSRTEYSGLIETFCKSVRTVCPQAQFTLVREPPCLGAVRLALRMLQNGSNPFSPNLKTFTNLGGVSYAQSERIL